VAEREQKAVQLSVLEFEKKLDEVCRMESADYLRQRRTKAEELGIPCGHLDDERKRRQKAADEEGKGGLPSEPEPWHEPVNGAQLLNEICIAVGKHLILPKGAASAVSLWTLFAHAHDCFQISPILTATSPTPECGKTTFAILLSNVTPRPLPGSNFSTAVIYRGIDAWSPTLIIDEGDTYLKEDPALRGILNSGHNRSLAWVLRAEGEDFTPTRFSTWAPKVVALIGKLHPTLASRSIHIELKRKMPSETVDDLRADRVGHLLLIRRKAMRWAADNADRLTGFEPQMPDFLHGRAGDNWRPLFAIADIAGGEWPKRVREVAETFSAKKDDEVYAINLLSDIRTILGDAEAMHSEDILVELVKMEDRPWPEWRNGREITKAQMAKLLGAFDVKSKQVWANGKNLHGYRAEALKDAFARYLPPLQGNLDARTLEPLSSKELRGIQNARAEKILASEKDSKPLSINGSSGLAVEKPLGPGNGPVSPDNDPFAHLRDPSYGLQPLKEDLDE
jgi:putative DNA primase/helicase